MKAQPFAELRVYTPGDFGADDFMNHDWGLAAHSRHRADPPLHIVHQEHSTWRTWCGGGFAYHGERNVTGRVCRRCRALAWQEYLDLREPGQPWKGD